MSLCWHTNVILGTYAGSNFDMLSTWLTQNSLNAMFGKQANLYLEYIKKMRIFKYCSPPNLSSSTWGTGIWVSENYLFFARTQKFLITLPAIRKYKLATQMDIDFIIEYRTMLRLITSASASFSRIMSSKQLIPEMDCLIKIYMDSMVDLDSHILKNTTSETFFWGNDNDDESNKKRKPTLFNPIH